MIKKIDHIAIAVNDLDEEIKRYKEVLGMTFMGSETIADQKVKVAFFKVGDVNIELTTPTKDDSPVAKYLAKRGSGIHHIAYEVDDLQAQIEDLREKEVCMIDTEPRDGANHSRIAFAHPKSFSGVLIELKQKGQEKPK